MTIYGFRNQNYSKTGGYGQPYPYNGTQNESVNQWNYQPNNYLMQHNELPSRRTQATIFYFQPRFMHIIFCFFLIFSIRPVVTEDPTLKPIRNVS